MNRSTVCPTTLKMIETRDNLDKAVKAHRAGQPHLEKRTQWVICGILVLASAFSVAMNLTTREYQILKAPTQHAPIALARPPVKPWNNLLVEEFSNYTSTLEELLYLNATSDSACYTITTESVKLEGLPPPVDGMLLFQSDMVHHLTLVAYGEDGNKRCAGGDYFEADFHDRENVTYRSRLPTVDFGDGTYGLDLIVPSQFAGAFVLEIWLLFTNWHGMDSKLDAWVTDVLPVVVLTQELQLGTVVGEDDLKIERSDDSPHDDDDHQDQQFLHLKQCTQADFDRPTWQGRWTRSWFNDSCAPDSQVRFRCLPEEHYSCEEPWCFGPVGRLESNGWEYSAHCSFKIFEREEAWECLDGRWFLLWGDSNFQDTMRNLVLFILDWDLPRQGPGLSEFQLARTYEMGFVNPHKYDQLFRVSQIFNGAHDYDGNGEGLNTLRYESHQKDLLAHFNGTRWPDTILMNSGLHDGVRDAPLKEFADAADFMIDWWIQLYYNITAERRPQLIWRTTVTPAGMSRKMDSNPNKMEMFNLVMVEKLQQVHSKLPVKFVDGFDLSFPFHYNNEYSDGGHYGRAPGTPMKPWYWQPHWYFVDIMLAHIFLNAACPSPEVS